MKNPQVKLRIAKEVVALSGVVELILGTYCGYQFGARATFRAWVFVGILAVICYLSTKLWIWCLGQMTKR